MISKIDLSGAWGFRADEEKKGIENHFYSSAYEDKIFLPSTTSQQKKGRLNTKREEGFLTDEYFYEGCAWYYKTVEIPEITDNFTAELFLERTRISELWVNGVRAGGHDSLCTPHVYDISEYVRTGSNEICIMIKNTDYLTKGGHMTSPDTQSNWNGITGEISLIISEKKRIANIRVFPNIESSSAELEISLQNTECADVEIWGSSSDGKIIENQIFKVTKENPVVSLKLENVSLWSEYNPVVYTLKARIKDCNDVYTAFFGMRKFEADGMQFRINNQKVYLRGRHDGMTFPLTAYAPTTVEEWHSYLSKVKKWGFNHVRFHTCCPPDSAFTAADMLGIYMQPELPFWGTVSAPDDENYNESEQNYLIQEGFRILDSFGNHPSFVMMSLGNELWGSPQRLNEILEKYHLRDNHRLYTQGSNNFQFYPNIQPFDDFFSGVRLSRERLIRGSYASCDKPFGFVQTELPNTVHSYDRLIFPENSENSESQNLTEIEIQYGTGVKKVKVNSGSDELIPNKPIITHEVGQYCSYPDFDEIKEYNGVLKARNLEIFRERLKEKNMLSYAEMFHKASGMLAFNCYKLEIESAMRSQYISGFQLLDLQDFMGQGTALVGMLNGLMQEKKFVRENNLLNEWLGFCSDAVILAEIENFVVKQGDTLTIPIYLRYMRPEKLHSKKIAWAVEGTGGELEIPENFSGLGKIGEITFEVSTVGKFGLFLVSDIQPENTACVTVNSYNFWAFPAPEQNYSLPTRYGDVWIESDAEKAVELLSEGKKVLYLPNELPESIKGFYCTDFWCYPMFRSISESMGKEIPTGTLGLLIDSEHPALADFPCEYYSTPQWFNIVSHSECAVLDCTPEEYRPIVQTIDNFERNHKLGILYESKFENGKLMVCTSRLSEIAEYPEVQAFIKSILGYMTSDSFNPQYEYDFNTLGLA